MCYNNDLGCGCDTPAADSGYDCDGNCLNDTDSDGVCDEFEIAITPLLNLDPFDDLDSDYTDPLQRHFTSEITIGYSF